MDQNKLVQVCAECLTASCWYGEFMCEEARHADLVFKTVRELRALKREHPENWTDKKFLAVYGTATPFAGLTL